MYVKPPTQTNYNKIISKIERNYYDTYKKAQIKILKELTCFSKYHDLDMLKKTF